MSLPDVINGLFEGVGGFMMLLDCARLMWEKAIAGVNWQVRAFFLAWGVWNLFYYPNLGQWFSFGGGLLIVIANAIWVALAIHYTRKDRDMGPWEDMFIQGNGKEGDEWRCPHGSKDWEYCSVCFPLR